MKFFKERIQRRALILKEHTRKTYRMNMFGCQVFSFNVLAAILVACMALTGNPISAHGESAVAGVKFIAEMTVDDDNRLLNYPSRVFFDPFMSEIYLVNSGRHRVVVYGPDFFPRASIGRGHGVLAPIAGQVDSNGNVYILQPRSKRNPAAKITILNAAFFPEKEIYLEQIPELAHLNYRNITVNRDGIIYLTGENNRGVSVLDSKGNFLRRLEPTGQVPAFVLNLEKELAESKKRLEEPEPVAEELEEKPPEEDIYAGIPEEFRPRKDTDLTFGEVTTPVKIFNVTIDKEGNLYLVSHEVSKIYVYDAEENFLFSFGKKGGSPGQMSRPVDLAVDENRNMIFVADYMRHTILAYDMTGKYLFDFGGRGIGPGWFNFPSGLAINNLGQLIVADLFNRRVQIIEPTNYSRFLDNTPSESLEESSDVEESQVQNEVPPAQPDDLVEEPSGVEESQVQDEPPPAQPESLSSQGDMSEFYQEQPGDLVDEELIIEEDFIKIPETFSE